MKTNNILELIKTNGILIPNSLLKFYKSLNINEKELIFLSYLMNKGEKVVFDVSLYCKETSFDLTEIMMIVSSLTEKKLLNMIVMDKKEYLDISSIYVKITDFLIDLEEQEVKEEVTSNIYEKIEKEFGRTLSPIEYETIKSWLDSNVNEELIIEALKEAVLNGVSNLKYIDKILYEWNRKGYKKATDIKRKKDLEVNDEKIEFYDYDWLDDNE